MSFPILHPFVEHECGLFISCLTTPRPSTTPDPTKVVDDFLKAARDKACPRCGLRVTDMIKSIGYYRLEPQRSWWKPWTWFYGPELAIVYQTGV